MAIPTKQELNGRALYLLIDPNRRDSTGGLVLYASNPEGLQDHARKAGLVLVHGFIAYDGREADQETS